MPLRWSHTVVYVRDLEAMIDFYTNVLGFEVTDRGKVAPADGAPEIVFMSQVETDHHQIAFLGVRQDDAPPNSVNHMAFRTDSLSDVRSMLAALKADGRATHINPLTHGNAWSVYFTDPEGNGLEVFADTPWHVQQPQGKPWDTSLTDDELHAWTQAEFEKEPGFGPIDAFYAARAEKLRQA
ncbi:MAG: VOC family protein [Deltaproteobacteria bacterium]|nr:VOC family protein [Deltaproteobacteria bacterium]MBW2416747.1 VOC family protein [Deltaproteobacteria bacterium]